MKMYIILWKNEVNGVVTVVDKVFASRNAANNFVRSLGAEEIHADLWQKGEYDFEIIEADYMEY